MLQRWLASRERTRSRNSIPCHVGISTLIDRIGRIRGALREPEQ
jgi:hypothetical protein